MPPGRWFVDENLIKIGRALEQVRRDVVYPGSSRLTEIPRKTLDDLWMPIVGDRGYAVVTRDRRIRSRPVERMRFEEHRIRAFCLTSTADSSDWDKLSLIVRQWPAMESQYAQLGPGPWMCSVTTAGVSLLPPLT